MYWFVSIDCLGCELSEGWNLPWEGRGSLCKTTGLFTLEIGISCHASLLLKLHDWKVGSRVSNDELVLKGKGKASVIGFADGWLQPTDRNVGQVEWLYID